jgi:phage tail-like protein
MPEIRTRQNKRHDPFRKFQFTLAIQVPTPQPDGATPIFAKQGGILGFSEISGLRSETELVEYKEGDNTLNRKIPGKSSFDNIVCSRGMDPDNTLSNWRSSVVERKQGGLFAGAGIVMAAMNDENIRMDLVISLYDRRGIHQGGRLLKQWKAWECWPVVYEVEELSGNASDVLIERVEFATEFMTLLKGSPVSKIQGP